MPTYDFHCSDCGHTFEELVWNDERPACAECGGNQTERGFPNSDGDAEAETPEYSWGDEAEESGPRNPRMRNEFPELWDLERNFEQRQSAQLVEIAEKSVRIGELMQQVEALEPLVARLAERDAQLAAALESVRVLSETECEQSKRLEQAASDLDERDAMLRELRAELEQQRADAQARQDDASALLRERDGRIADLNDEVRKLETDLASRTAALFKRDEMIQDADQTIAALREDVREYENRDAESKQEQQTLNREVERQAAALTSADESLAELQGELDERRSQLRASRDELGRTKARIEELEAENAELTEGWANSKLEVEHHRAKFLESVRHLSATHSVLEEMRPMLDSLETTLSPEQADGR